MLAEKYKDQIADTLARYPADQKRSAVMPLLYIAQAEYGYVTKEAMDEVADIIGVDPTQVASIVGFYSLYYDHQGGRHRIQVCTDLPCALKGADKFAADLCQKFGVKLGGTTKDGQFTIEAVMCLAACDKAPMFQVQNKDGIFYHENQTVESAAKVMEGLQSQ
ncbi:MAG TPA: NADH-quinone oxidoreductase subunit NuoE [Anaerolineales bacterium]|nr:NADH-quinone oxidoreductase subunit NuoE [Anaerolineales bacterium]